MKTMKYVLSASVMTFMLASCSEKIEEENVNASQPDAGKIEMTFTSQASGTKTQLGDDGLSVVWSEGDAISIFDGADNERFSIGNINGSSAEFSGLAVPASEYYAVYPYAKGNSMSAEEGVITAVLPDSQPAIPGTFAQNVNLSFAKADAENHLSFRNLCGLLSLDLANVPAGLESIAISGQNGEILAGTVSINAANGTTSVSGGMKVTLTGENLAGGVYVAAVHPVTFEKGLYISFKFADGTSKAVRTSESIAVSAGKKVCLPQINVGAAGEDKGNGTQANPYRLYDAEDLQNMKTQVQAKLDAASAWTEGQTAIECPVWFSLENDIDMEGVEWEPVYNPAGYDINKYPVINFDGHEHKISNLKASGKAQASFFGVLIGTAYNLTFENAKITSDEKSPAGIVASSLVSYSRTEKSKLDHVYVTGGSVKGKYYDKSANIDSDWDKPAYGAGGLCGVVRQGSILVDCAATSVKVDGTYAGGIAGAGQDGGEIIRCTVEGGEISTHGVKGGDAMGYAGGIAGYLAAPGDGVKFILTDSHCEGTAVSAEDLAHSAGGVLGKSGNDVQIEKCFSRDVVLKGRLCAGGIVGSAEASYGLTVKNCVGWCTSYSIAPWDETFYGIGYIIGAWNGGWLDFSGCWSNESDAVQLMRNGATMEVMETERSDKTVTGDVTESGNRYCGQPAASFEEACQSAGISSAE